MKYKRNWLVRDVLIGIGISVSLLTAGCGTRLTVAPKPVNAHAIAFSGSKQNAGIIDCDANGCKVDYNFIQKYRQMESEFHKSSPDDVNIKQEGDHWRVSYEVISHFTELKAAERGA